MINTAISDNPRTLVLSAPRGRWSASRYEAWGKTMNGVESWVYAFQGDYSGYQEISPQDLQHYDLVIANAQNLKTMIRLAENRPSNVRWVLLVEGDANDYVLVNPLVQKAIAVSDMVNCINRFSLPLFRELARGTAAKVEYLGIPYPVDGVRHYAKKPELRFNARSKTSMICAPLLSRSNDYLVARSIGIPYYGYEQPLIRKIRAAKHIWRAKSLDKYVYVKQAQQLYNDPNLQVRLGTSLQDFFSANTDAYLWINLDPRFTWARYVLDAAALGIPVITTHSTGHGQALFPQTTLPTHFDLDLAITLGQRLVEDKEFYCSVSESASENIKNYAPGVIKQRLTTILFHQ